MLKKQIKLIYYGSINSPTGVSTVIHNIINGFEKCNSLAINVYTNTVGLHKLNKNKKHFIKPIFRFIHNLLSFLAGKFVIFTDLYIWTQYHRNAINISKKFHYDNISDNTILFFHDVFTPYHFKKIHNLYWENNKKTIVLHTDGDVFKMLYTYYPLLTKNKNRLIFYEKLALDLLSDMDIIILLSNNAKEIFCTKYPFFLNKVIVIPNGLDIKTVMNKNVNTSDKFVFTTVGTLSYRKGQDLIIKAVELMSDSERNSFIVNIVGDGLIFNELQSYCKHNKITNINFLGTRRDIDELLSMSDCFILASRDEGLPMAIIEAMANELPIISTNVGGIPDLVVDELNGLLVDPNNEYNLKNAMLRLINMPYEDRSKMGKESLSRYTNNYTQEIMTKSYLEMFRSI